MTIVSAVLNETISADANVAMRSYLQRIATGPELSKPLSFEEARHGMQLILDQAVDPVQAGIFLIALRMKRETDEENQGVLQALLDSTEYAQVEVDELIDIADPYDGYTRGLPATAFLPAVLAAAGLPAVCHGAESVGPKYGVTPSKVYQAAGIRCDLSPQQAAECLTQKDLGWAYLDQQAFCPKLHNLLELRTLMVKRPCITTVEVLLGPLRARSKTHLMTGFVHKAYPPVYTMLARQSKFDSALVIRGVEGGVIPSLSQPSRLFRYSTLDDDTDEQVRLDPQELSIEQTERAVPQPEDLPPPEVRGDKIATTVNIDAAAAATAEAGLAALRGVSGPMYDSLVYGAAIALWQTGRYASLAEGAAAARQLLNSGAALAHFQNNQ